MLRKEEKRPTIPIALSFFYLDKEYGEQLLRAMILSDYKRARESTKWRCKKGLGRSYVRKICKRKLINLKVNKNRTLRNQLLEDKEYWERVATLYCS